MILLTSGCSYTYGDELDSREEAWPFILGKLLNSDKVINKGLVSGSNDFIVRTIIDNIDIVRKEEYFVVCGFTTENRIEAYCTPYDCYMLLKVGREFKKVPNSEIKSLYPKEMSEPYKEELNKVSQDFMKYFSSDTLANLIRKADIIVLLGSFLRFLNIPFLFFNSLTTFNLKDTFMKKKYLADKYFKRIQNLALLGKNYINNPTFDEFTIKNNYPRGSYQKHPLQEAHKKWAEYLNSYIIENKILEVR